MEISTPDTLPKISKVQSRFRLPDPPEDPEDKMTSFDHLAATGNAHYLAHHPGESGYHPGDRGPLPGGPADQEPGREPVSRPFWWPSAWTWRPTRPATVNIISEQGEPPDLVLEVASESTAGIDVGEKRGDYAALGIPEYWRFDETGRYHGTRLAGERLVEGEYAALDIEELGGSLQGHSAALDLNIRWERGELVFYDPATGEAIATLEDESARAEAAEAERDAEREARNTAEARVCELEERLRRRGARVEILLSGWSWIRPCCGFEEKNPVQRPTSVGVASSLLHGPN